MTQQTEVVATRPWHAHMNISQGYSHMPIFVAAFILFWMAWSAHTQKWGNKATGTLGVVGLFLLALSITSTMMHKDIEDGEVDDAALGKSEMYALYATVAVGVAAFVGAWFVGREGSMWDRAKAPFSEPIFKFLMTAWALTLAGIPWLISNSAGYYAKHAKVDERGWTDNYEISNVYHVQWHTWVGFFAILTAFAMYIIVKQRWGGIKTAGSK